MEEVVEIDDKNGLDLEGRGSTLFSTTRGYRERALIRLNAGGDLAIRGFNLDGGNTGHGYVAALEAQHGIWVGGSTRVLIQGNSIRNVRGDFVYLGPDVRSKVPTNRQSASDITVVGNVMNHSGRQGVTATQTQRVLVAHNVIERVARSTFDLEPNGPSWSVRDVTISRNQIGAKRLNFVAAAGRGIVENVIVRRNVLRSTAMNSMILGTVEFPRRNWTFLRNRSYYGYGSPIGAAVLVSGVQGFRFVNNSQALQPGRHMVGLRVDGFCGAIARKNRLPNGVAQMSGVRRKCPRSIRAQTSVAVRRPHPVPGIS